MPQHAQFVAQFAKPRLRVVASYPTVHQTDGGAIVRCLGGDGRTLEVEFPARIWAAIGAEAAASQPPRKGPADPLPAASEAGTATSTGSSVHAGFVIPFPAARRGMEEPGGAQQAECVGGRSVPVPEPSPARRLSADAPLPAELEALIPAALDAGPWSRTKPLRAFYDASGGTATHWPAFQRAYQAAYQRRWWQRTRAAHRRPPSP